MRTTTVRTEEGVRIVATSRLETDHPIFAGHYPGFPLMPGVYLVDLVRRAVQAADPGGGVIVERPGTVPPGAIPLELAEVESCRFVGPTFPGDEVVVEVMLSPDGPQMLCTATITSAGRPAAQIRYRTREATPALAPAADPSPVRAADVLGPDDITRIIPHRPPMLLVDRVSELEPGRRIVAHRAVTGAESWFGPVEAVLPQSLLLESWAQSALVLLLADRPTPDVLAGEVPVAGVVEGVRFGPSVPVGAEIAHEITFGRRFGQMSIVRGSSRVGDTVVLEVGRMMAAMAPTSALLGALAPEPLSGAVT